MEAFLNMKSVQSEMDANGKRRRCKVTPMPMERSGYCVFSYRLRINVYRRLRNVR
jgi:hypothetical protein